MEPLTLFTWGYWGWGSATDRLVQAVDAVEAARGFQPPLFVDIRISRSVRAPGFNGNAFERTVGPSRYRWMPDLGNAGVLEHGPMRIKDPSAANALLDLALVCATEKRRLLFFCSCEFPGVDGQDGCCHRTVVAGLVLRAAEARNQAVQVVEWPGGEPLLDLAYSVQKEEFKKIKRGNRFMSVDGSALADIAGVPWCSRGSVFREAETDEQAPYFDFVTGPARYRNGGWYLPFYEDIDPDIPDDKLSLWLQERQKHGYQVRVTRTTGSEPSPTAA